MNEVITPPARREQSLLLDPVRFEAAQRAGRLLATSGLFPQHLKAGGEQVAISNAVMVLNIADRMREDPLAVAQNIYFVHGKPGWNASYMISRANQSGRFKGGIRWDLKGGDDVVEASGAQKLKDYKVTCYALLASDGSKVDAEISMQDAFLQGWTKRGKDGGPSKYETMGRQMLQYRAATLLVRLYCPEVMLGYSVVEELEDVAVSGLKDVTPSASVDPIPEPANNSEPVVEAEIVEDDASTSKHSKKKETAAKSAGKKTEAEKPPADDRQGDAPAEKEAEAPADDGDQADGSVGELVIAPEIEGAFNQISESYDEAKSAEDIAGLNDLFAEALTHMANDHPDARAELEAREEQARGKFS
ncbi:MAG: hypothetical protein AAF479_10610 [Pseudomonadota bacterium]